MLTRRALLANTTIVVGATVAIVDATELLSDPVAFNVPTYQRDDTAHVQAKLDNGGAVILDGIYHITQPLLISKSRTCVMGGDFMCHSLPAGQPLFLVASFDNDLMNQHIEGLRGPIFRVQA